MAQRLVLDHKKKSKFIDRSLLDCGSVALFRSDIRNPRTSDQYERKVLSFLKDIEMPPDTFVALAKDNPKAAEKILISYIDKLVDRAERGEISKNTIRNPKKTIKLLLDMNDVTSINLKKLGRLIPRGRDYARPYTHN